MGKLTAAKIRSLSEPGRYSDGDGLFLEINGRGAASWVLRVQSGGKRQDIGLGSAKSVSLKDARAAAYATRQKIAQGIDPVAERKQERITVPTFREPAASVHEEHRAAWKNGKHQQQWISTLESYACPAFGDRPVNEIEGPAIRDVLALIWLSKPETARRVRQRIATVLDWACAKGFFAGSGLRARLRRDRALRSVRGAESLSGVSDDSDDDRWRVAGAAGRVNAVWSRIRKIADLEHVCIHDLRHSFALTGAGCALLGDAAAFVLHSARSHGQAGR